MCEVPFLVDGLCLALPNVFPSIVDLRTQVVNIPNSMTVLTDLLPISLAISERRLQVWRAAFCGSVTRPPRLSNSQ